MTSHPLFLKVWMDLKNYATPKGIHSKYDKCKQNDLESNVYPLTGSPAQTVAKCERITSRAEAACIQTTKADQAVPVQVMSINCT